LATIANTPNTLRRSSAPDDATLLNNYPGRYPTEDWTARYWTVNEEGALEQRQVTLQLPEGFSQPCMPVMAGHPGCIRVVRRWGVGCYPEVLNEIGFDFAPLLSDPNDDSEWLAHYFNVVTFDLPGFFVIASPSHPFLLYDPAGRLKGGYTEWRTHLGALSFLVSGLDAGFVGLQVENKRLYQQALGYLLEAIGQKPPDDSA
jgi:hypothetical protein